MAASWVNEQFAQDEALREHLPAELMKEVLQTTGSDFLAAVANAALAPGCTERVFVFHELLIPEIAARWIGRQPSTFLDDINVLACFARILPYARYLRPAVVQFMSAGRFDASRVREMDAKLVANTLLAIFRLLSTEPRSFADVVRPTFLSGFFTHDSLAVRYLAIQSMCIVMRFADSLQEKLVHAYVGTERIHGVWEGKEVDLRLLKLFEEKRWMDLKEELVAARAARGQCADLHESRFTASDLCSTTASLGGQLVPRDAPLENQITSFVDTPTAVQNLRSIGRALLQQKPVLLTGPGGSGKTTLIRESARLLNRLSSMITLHLNEQTDAKSLLGVYTSSLSGESFVWQPGVLTKAVQQGRWVLIEDIDKAPSEVLSVLRPIIENAELFLPSRKERIRPQEGFKVFATIKLTSKAERGGVSKHAWLVNERLWSTVGVQQYSRDEIQNLLQQRFPAIQLLLPGILRSHFSTLETYEDDPSFRAVQGRLPSLRDLLKWCRRTNERIKANNIDLTTSGMPEYVKLDIFKDGVDCYAIFHSDVHVYRSIVQIIAQTLNISPQQVEHSLSAEAWSLSEGQGQVSIGRSVLSKIQTRRLTPSKRANFAMTSQSKRTMDSIAAGTSFSEPLLLVGETGVGKTTQVQYVANLVNQKLTVVNLSQQSEAADLLGGLKPITTRSLVIPLVDQFSSLFDDTFSSKRNKDFQTAISRAIAKERWPRLVLLWQEAVGMAEKSLKTPFEAAEADGDGQSAKRRKLISKYAPLRERWTDFSSKLNHVRASVERGDKNHSFAFVEGRLVQAVRNGEWLLFDEINLASADTLDHVVGLLSNSDDEKPSLLLAEAGNIETIHAHPNFRIFAAMNPATDTGKKDLAPGIRSRFTEIYVQSGDDEVDDLVKIIETYLGAALSSDKRAAQDIAKAYLQLKKLNIEHKLTDGAGDIPHFSIRSLVRCLLYVIQHNASHGLRRSMYEGFAMSFFTVLSIESEKLCLPMLITHLLANVKNAKSFLSQQPKMTFDAGEYVAFKHHLVRRGTNSPDLQPHYIRTPSVERNLMNLARAASMRRFPILLQGPTSAGKTSMVEYLAKLSGNQFVRINNHEHTDLQEYLGSYATGNDGKLEFREGVLVEALRKGHWIVLDELNLAPSDVLEALNRLLDDNRELLIPESQEIVRPHPSFMLFATQNPAGLYGGRKRLSRAFRNRFLELHLDDIPEDELEVILRERTQIPPSFCTQIVQVYKKLSLQRQSTRLFESRNSFATLRDLFRWASRRVDDRQQLARHGFMLLAERVRDSAERALVKTTIEETMKTKIDEKNLYSAAVIPESIRTNGNVVWTSAMRRLFVLVSEALRNNEPVLLVGETGCGKTQICQTVAQAFGKQLNIYNAHSNTETGDLIGSQRPTRQRSELVTALLDSFSQLYTSENNPSAVEGRDIDELIDSFNKMDPSGFEPDAIKKMRRSIAAYQSLFTWADGSLVRSMKAGEHFLLDEISLADDSVLERLNSVLEPSRTILLAEKGPMDNLVIANSDFQFLSTMNPGGDYGKRELSAALRNRLTEIWVPPLSQSSDILPILSVKLGEHSCFAQPMLDFATWFKDNMQNSATSTIPLRSLLAWAEFVCKDTSNDANTAFVHGAFMVYIDSLGANPAGLTNILGGDLQSARKTCLEKLSQITHIAVLNLYAEIPRLDVNQEEVKVGCFPIPRCSSKEDSSDLVFDAPTTMRNAMRIARALQMNRPILLEGSPGVGKTAIVTALAAVAGRNLTRINLADQTDLMDLFGADVPSESENLGRFLWRDGPLLKAMRLGEWVLLDEMNLASQSVLEGLNSCLDHRHEVYIAELDKSFICHPDFTLFAAQNPHHQGGGRKGLPASFVNRFTIVYADPFEREDLMLICGKKRPNVSKEHLSAIIDTISGGHELVTNASAFSAGGPWELNLRDVNRWLDLLQNYDKLPASQHFASIISQRFRSSFARESLAGLCQEFFGKEPEPSLYHNLSPELFQLGTSLLERHTHRQDARMQHLFSTQHLQYAKSAIVAINHDWPVLLVGPSGCGKTTLIRNLAAINGAKLVEFSMNADIDTMDLIGGFEQHDSRRDVLAVQQATCDLLMLLICDFIVSQDDKHKVASLIHIYEQCLVPNIQIATLEEILIQLSRHLKAFNDLRDQISSIHFKSKGSRFVWNDGILIDALQDGSWLVLDNANLCNPSVLDRLNSLLEPNGALAVSEQHGQSGDERIVRPHRNFRIFLTMDPKYGELSRAMRNRSLELFMVTTPESDLSLLQSPCYPTASSIYRPRIILQSPCDDKALISGLDIVSPSLAALTNEEMNLVINEARNLFKNNSIDVVLRSCAAPFSAISPAVKNLWPYLLSKVQTDPSLDQRMRRLRWQDQPQTFILNDALIRLRHGSSHFPDIDIIAQQYLVEYMRSQLRCKFQESAEQAGQLDRNQMTIMQRSIDVHGRSKAMQRRDAVPNAAGFLTTILNHDSGGFGNSLLTSSVAVQSLRSFVLLAKDIFDFFNTKAFDYDIFQAYLQIAGGLTQALPYYERVLKQVLEKALSSFDSQLILSSGQSLYRMWSKWKPVTAATIKQLETQITMEQLLSRFDEMAKSLVKRKIELAQIRSGLSAACKFITKDNDPEHTAATFSKAIEALAVQKPSGKIRHGHFTSAFEWALRKLVVQGKRISELDFQRLSLFTKPLPIALDQLPLSVPSALFRLAFLNSSDVHHAAVSGAELSSRLTNVESEPLYMLDYVQDELTELAYITSTYTSHLLADDSSALLDYVHILILGILRCHYDLFTEDARKCFIPNDRVDLKTLARLRLRSLDASQISQVGHFERIYSKHVLPVIVVLSGEGNATTALIGSCLAAICVAALQLLVPDKACDPSIYPAVVSQRHQKRIAELQAQITVHRQFQERFTGQTSSTLIRVFEQELRDLGEVPQPPAIVRPVKSELQTVQQEFNNVLGNIVNSNQLATIMSQFHSNSTQAGQIPEACSVIQPLISRVVDRLSRLNRAYDDIVKPVIWLLESTSFGIKLMRREHDHDNSNRHSSALKLTPLLGGSPGDITGGIPANLKGNAHIKRSYLNHLQFQNQIQRTSGPTFAYRSHALVMDFVNIVDKFYVEWKSQLSKDQIQAEARSKYYAYRGEDDEAQEVDVAEMASIFPVFEQEADGEQAVQRNGHDPRGISIKLAALHTELHDNNRPPISLHRHIVDVLASSRAPTFTSQSFAEMLPGILLQMEKATAEVQKIEPTQGLNIYNDSDTVESRKLVQLVQRIQDRFQEISEKWPEHAVPIEVLDYSEELLSFEINEPIAKLLTKTEKLFQIVSQWQSVASREWSVQNLMDELTSIIIHWRRLELSSWSRLLEIERKKIREDANAWYFIAYEAVLYNSRLVVDQMGDVSTYCQELARTLEDFLRSTTLGQFSCRLNLLKAFKETLDIFTQQDERLKPVAKCVAGVLFHYERYESNIQQLLTNGRLPLEKDLSEQIKLASWKDTNVQSLRDSARRSHFKLFKIIKKYRSLLSQPISSFKSIDSATSVGWDLTRDLFVPHVDAEQHQAVSELCSSSIADWKLRPERLTNPDSAAASMRKLYSSQFNDFSAPKTIAAFHADVTATAAELRKQTPQTLTEDNTPVVRHLRERKRRLFADTMRTVAQMGIRRNLATGELLKQSSVSTILASSPDVSRKIYAAETQATNAAFHEVIDNMPGVRNAATEHSDDLTEGETRRAIGLLEGLLSIEISQRAELNATVSSLHDFSSVLKLVKHMREVGYDKVNRQPREYKNETQWLYHCLLWLPQILEVSMQVIRFQSQHGSFDATGLIKALQQRTEALLALKTELDSLPEMPVGLGSLLHKAKLQAVRMQLDELNGVLTRWQGSMPDIAYLCEQIIPWTKPFGVSSSDADGLVQMEPMVIDKSTRTILDSILVSMQKLTSTLFGMPDSTEDAGWLLKSDKILSASIKSLHLEEMSSQLNHVLAQLQHLSDDSLALGVSLVVVATPVLEQYFLTAQNIYQTQLATHNEICRLGVFLTKSFVSLASEGFCTPQKPLDGQDQQSGKLESGTGLGDGEGAEDISKDVGDDDDLSELAQAQNEKEDGEQEMDREKDAVDMGMDDLEGAMGSGDEKGSEDEDDKDSGSDDENDMDEETGSVDDLDPSAVDEKLWDDMRKEDEKDEKEMRGDKQKGQKADEQTEKEDGAKDDGDDEMEGMDEADGSDEDEQDDTEGGDRPEAENLDPHLQQEEALELPEEMQLTGEEDGKEDKISDDGMDEFSDVENDEQPVSEKVDDLYEEMENRENADVDDEDEVNAEDTEEQGKAQDDEIIEDQPDEAADDKQDSMDTRDNEMQYDLDDSEGGDTGTANQRENNANEAQDENAPGQNDQDEIVNEQQTQPGKGSDKEQSGDASRGALEQGAGKDSEPQQKHDDALQKLVEALEQYHQRREILTASEERKQGELDQDVDMNDADFEHVGENEEETDAQALGAASADQVQKLDESKAIEQADVDTDQDLPMPEDQEVQEAEAQETIAERFSRLQNQPRQSKGEDAGAILPDRRDRQQPQSAVNDIEDEDDVEEIEMSTNQPDHQDPNILPTSDTDAAALWSHCSTRTHALSLLLTEQLRLILAPTTATKLRGDFRTGKRLNIKRIIPYIASGYKRDKIWMRRSVPSKRAYQIMLAVDDSKSMSESGADLLAFETLAMLTKSLSMLEVGELCVVGFGDNPQIRVAHPFSQPFTSTDSGPEVFRAFSFQQRGTDVRRLLKQSIAIFEDARLRSHDNLWQLQLIISDGHCSDHDSIRRLVRRAHELKIMIVFVVVDAGQHSIVDLKEAVFERVDPTDELSEMKVRTKRYLEGFPFGYYVVVRDVSDLPGVLARVLKGWFESVVNVG